MTDRLIEAHPPSKGTLSPILRILVIWLDIIYYAAELYAISTHPSL